MAKFYRKTAVVEAKQWRPGERVEGVLWYTPPDSNLINPVDGSVHRFPQETYPIIDLPEGRTLVQAGDWIVTDAEGKKSVCRWDKFELMYGAIDG